MRPPKISKYSLERAGEQQAVLLTCTYPPPVLGVSCQALGGVSSGRCADVSVDGSSDRVSATV